MKEYCSHQRDSLPESKFFIRCRCNLFLFPVGSRLEENPIGIVPEIGIATPASGGEGNAQVA